MSVDPSRGLCMILFHLSFCICVFFFCLVFFLSLLNRKHFIFFTNACLTLTSVYTHKTFVDSLLRLQSRPVSQ